MQIIADHGFWTAAMRACLIPSLFIISSFTANRANAKRVGMDVKGCALWKRLRFPQLTSILFMNACIQCTTLLGHNPGPQENGQSLQRAIFAF